MPKASLFAISLGLVLAANPAHSKQGDYPSELINRFASISGDQYLVNAIVKDGDVKVISEESLIEEIFQEISNNADSYIRFYCLDPLEIREKRSLTISAASLAEAIKSVLQEFRSDDGAVIEEVKAPAGEGAAPGWALRVYAKSCPRQSEPLRSFVPFDRHPVLKGPPEEVELRDLEEILHGEGPGSRRLALHYLMLRDDERALTIARDAAADPNSTVMLAAIRALMILGKRYDVDFAADAVEQSLRERPFFETLRVLAKLDKERSWQVIRALQSSPSEPVQREVVRVLAVTKDARGLQWLEALSFSPSEELAEQAILTIGLMGGLESERVLRNVLAKGDMDQKARAAKGLALMPAEERQRAERDLIFLVREGETADPILAAMIATTYVAPLEKILRDPQADAAFKTRILDVAAEHGTERTIETIVQALDDKDPEVRLAAVQAMNAIITEGALPYFLRAASDNDGRVRAAAANGLGRFWLEAPIISALEKGLHDREEAVRKASIEAFSELGKPDEAVEEVLRAATRNDDRYVSDQARSLLKYWRLN